MQSKRKGRGTKSARMKETCGILSHNQGERQTHVGSLMRETECKLGVAVEVMAVVTAK